ncbi:hypothetical protein [Rosenbergiella epipactidis]|uniref:hypothetical protein n=1 Tax=Rosenbergiella epipactidis TaxID=1544694 RepID=UPI001F4FBB2A|nr:hypothetical protein [Rosenbergiella epipactidis]
MIKRNGTGFPCRHRKSLAPYIAYYNPVEARFEFEPLGNTRNIKKGFVSHYMEFPEYMEPTGTMQ